MTKILNLFLLFVLISCSSETSDNESVTETPEDELELSLDLERNIFGIDERIIINASSDETLSLGCIGSDFFNPDVSQLTKCVGIDNENQFQVSFSYQTVGLKTFFIKAQTQDGKVRRVERQIQVDSITNSVRISKVTLNTYPNKGKSFDSSFSDTDPERLADLYFQINKRYVGIDVSKETPSYKHVDLPISEVHENESSFEWNYENNELLFSVDNVLYFELFDLDGDPTNSEHFTNWFLNFGDYVSEKPSQINIDNYGGSVKVTFELDWN